MYMILPRTAILKGIAADQFKYFFVNMIVVACTRIFPALRPPKSSQSLDLPSNLDCEPPSPATGGTLQLNRWLKACCGAAFNFGAYTKNIGDDYTKQ